MSRALWTLLGTGFLLGLLWTLCPEALGQGKKKDDPGDTIKKLQFQLKEKEQQINKLEAQLQKLKNADQKDDLKLAQIQGQLKEKENRIKQLEAELKKKGSAGGKSAAQLQKELDQANQSLAAKDRLITTLQQASPKATADLTKEVESLRKQVKDLETVKKSLVAHAVYLKPKSQVKEEDLKQIQDEAGKTLAKIAGVRALWAGRPVSEPPSEAAFHIGIVVLVDDADALQKYLSDPAYTKFLETSMTLWDRTATYSVLQAEK